MLTPLSLFLCRKGFLFSCCIICCSLNIFGQQHQDTTINKFLSKEFPLHLNAANNIAPFLSGNPSIKRSTVNQVAVTGFDYPLQDCFTYTYKLKIGADNYNTLIKETVTTNNGETYLAGYVMDPAGRNTGLLQQLNHTGNIGWTKTLSFNNRNIVFNSIKQLPNGNLIVIGSCDVFNSGIKNIIFVQFDQDGQLIWCKTLSNQGYEGAGICVDNINGIGFSGYSNTTIIFGKLDYAGNLGWLKQCPLIDGGAIVGMGNYDTYSWFIAYDGMESSRHAGMLLRINPVNGNVYWINKYGGNISNQDFIFQDMAMSNLRPRITGIFSTAHAPYKLFKVTVNQTGQTDNIQVFDVPGASIDTTCHTSIDAGGRMIVFSPNQNDPDVYAIKTIPESGTGTLFHWAKKYNLPARHKFLHSQQTFDGGYIITTDIPGAVNNTVSTVLKTDSIGVIKNCEGSDFSFTNALQSFATVPYTAVVTNPLAVIFAENPILADGIITGDFTCKSLSCPLRPPEDSCLTSFIRKFRSVGFCDQGLDILPVQNEILFTGSMRNDPYNAGDGEGILGRLDSRGKLLAREKMKLGNNTGFYKFLKLSDGNLIVLGSSTYKSDFSNNDTGYVTLSKFTPTFQLIWNKSFPIYGPYSAVYGIVEGSDGSLFLNYIEGLQFCEKIRMLKLDSQGNFAWLKKYDIPNTCTFGYTGSITQDDSYLYLTNWGTGNSGNLFLKISKTSGAPVIIKGLNIAGINQLHAGVNMFLLGDNLLLEGRVILNNGGSKDIILILDKNGTIIKTKSFSKNNQYLALQPLLTRNKEIVLVSNDYNYNYFVRLDSNLNIIFSKRTKVNSGTTSIREDVNGSILCVGSFSYQDPYLLDLCFKKITYDGKLGSCFTDSLLLDTDAQVFLVTPLTATTADVPLSLKTLPLVRSSYSLQDADLVCSQTAACTSLHLNAPPGICDTLAHTMNATRTPGCTTPVNFTSVSNGVEIINTTDSSLTFKIRQSGNKQLTGAIFTGCVWLRDTVVINSSINGAAFSLGPDTSICPNNSVLLNAGNGYTSYLWNNGLTSSSISVTSPGIYSVSVTNACSDRFSDTIVVSSAAPVSIALGPDRTKCNSDSILLIAPPGFLNYFWGPSYNLTQVTNSQVLVNPLTDTSYYIMAEKTPGCFAYDTVRVHVNNSPVIFLGPDQSFCSGDSILLNAGNGFNSYSWNTGSISRQIVAHTAGNYWVAATDAAGCISKDTIIVINVFTSPAVNLGADFSLCKGDSRMLDAGSFVSYLWNNSSTARTLNVNNTGLYTVTVKDQHNCTGRDSITLQSILPLPEKFLPADMLICNYESLELSAVKNYGQYLWNTNSTNKTVTITQPGLYWLQVKDNYNCTGRDSIIIGQKDCLKGFYVPNAFSPNNDRKNELFKPLLFGNVIQYSFTIYNRWGQPVFSTNDISKGWNGIWKGVIQESGVFVWACIYQFENGSVKTERGNVTLIR